MLGVVLQGRGGEVGAAFAGVAGVEHQQHPPHRCLVENGARQSLGGGGAADAVGMGVGGDQDVVVGVGEAFAVAGEIHRHDVVGASIRCRAEPVELVEQLRRARVHPDRGDQGVTEDSGEQVDQRRPRVDQAGSVPLRSVGVFGDRGRDQKPPRP
nr:hypothetical protein [Nocardia takedensis]